MGLVRRHGDSRPIDLTAAVANKVADALGIGPVVTIRPSLGELTEPPSGWADPWLVGAIHEQAAPAAERKARGAWYTPRTVVEGLVRLATDDGVAPVHVVDPTCGGGAFLLAALDRLVELGLDPLEAIRRVGGTDLDADAVLVSRWSMLLWLGGQLGPGHPMVGDLATMAVDVSRGDAMIDGAAADGGNADGAVAGRPAWPPGVLVVGNPPFASPLKKGVVPTSAADYRSRRSDLLGPYADIAAAHLLRAVERAGAGSTVVLVQPQSILASRDTEALREQLDERAPLQAIWAAREAVFDAGVRACAPVLRVGGKPPDRVRLAHGPNVVVGGDRAPQRWSGHATDALGAPVLPSMTGTLADLVSATAGFRDEHYGLVGVCREARADEAYGNGRDSARLVTVGAVDPLTVAWGRRPYRFGGKDWSRPVVDRAGLSPKVTGWFDRQLTPKVLLATQTKLLEPVVDRRGDLMPATPLIAVHADAADLDRIAAVLLSPPVVVWAWRRWFGAALTVDAVKLAARQVAELPLPADELAWAEAAEIVAASDPHEPAVAWDAALNVATIMTEAYRASDDVLAWWRNRLKERPLAG